MSFQNTNHMPAPHASDWLKTYYYLRFGVSTVWVIAAFAVSARMPSLAALLLIAYPAWDALANYVDANRSGGLARNKSQAFNLVVSVVTTVAVAVALSQSMSAVLAVFGVWASLSGILQLVTGLRRWKTAGAQWAMILSGLQSTLAGVFMLKLGAIGADHALGIADIAPYAAFGAFYFLVSAVWLTVADLRRGRPLVA